MIELIKIHLILEAILDGYFLYLPLIFFFSKNNNTKGKKFYKILSMVPNLKKYVFNFFFIILHICILNNQEFSKIIN